MAKRGAEDQITKDGRRDDSDDNEEDPGVRVQPLAPVEGRQVRPMPKRKGLGSGTPSSTGSSTPTAKPAFSGFSFGAPAAPAPAGAAAAAPPAAAPFGGFGNFGASTTAAPTAQSADAPAAPPKPFAGFSFGAPPAPSTSPAPSAAFAGVTSGFNGFAPSSSSTPPPASASGSTVPASVPSNGTSTPSTRPTPSRDAPPPEGEVSYYTSICGLNSSILSFLSTTIVNDPFIDLSTILPNLGNQYYAHLDKSASSAGWRPAAPQAPVKPPSAFSFTAPSIIRPPEHKTAPSMPVPPAAPAWAMKPPAVPSQPPATGGFVPKLPAGGAVASPFAFGNFGKSADSAETAKAPEQPKAKPSTEAAQIVQDVLSEKPEKSTAPPASNPFSFGSTPTPSAQSPAATPSSETKKPLFSFAPSGPIHPTTPNTKTFTPSKSIEDPSPAKLGKFGPGGSQPQLSFGGAKTAAASQSGTPVASKTFSFGFGAAPGAAAAPAVPSASSGGASFSFGSSAATPTQPAATPSAAFSFGSTATPSFSFGSGAPAAEAPKPAPSTFSFGSAATAPPTAPPTTAPAFSFKPFGTPMSSNPSSSSITSAAAEPEAEAGGDDAPPDAGPPSVNLAASVGEGEENEETVFEQRGKLHRFANGTWELQGLGVFKLKKAKEGGKRRFLMRTDGGGHVVLNMAVPKTFKPTNQNKTVTFTGADLKGQPATFRLQVKTPENARDVVAKSLEEVEKINQES